VASGQKRKISVALLHNFGERVYNVQMSGCADVRIIEHKNK